LDVYLTPEQAANLLGVSLDTMNGWRSKGKGPPYIKAEGTIRYTRQDIETYMQENKIIPKGNTTENENN